MQTRHIIVEQNDPQWAYDFQKIKEELLPVVGNLIVAIEHVGSTSVPGLCAKPIIDIDIVIPNRESLGAVIEALAQIGYIHEGNLGIPDREAFKYIGKPHLKQHHLYVCPANSRELHRHITFRDYLRAHPEAIALYSKAKQEAAALHPNDIDAYMRHKSDCIEEIYKLCGLS